MIIFSLICQVRVKSTFSKYNRIRTVSGATADTVARQILDMNGLYNVQIMHVPGQLTDHFDPRSNIVALSDSTYGNATVGAIGVAAHECGHAIQYANNYTPIKLRQTIYPLVNFCSGAWFWVLTIGFFLEMMFVIEVGIAFYMIVVAFQLITLPVEFNASNRAIKTLDENMILTGEELTGAKKTLSAAAMTYVASFLTSLVQLLRLVLRFIGRRD
ncbi:MAG: zinc metallopeptidase [Ruminiclostridium sp.]|nr:zinc metallopeptidase [Ruminiclostridium sp.]